MGLKRARTVGLVPAAINAARLGYQAYQSYQGIKRKYNEYKGGNAGAGRSAPPITTQFDSRTLYRRKRASRRFRRKAKKYHRFVKKVIAAGDHRLEKQRVLFVDNTALNASANAQVCSIGRFMLYGGNTGVAAQRDLYLMETGLGDTSTSQTSTYYRSAHMEVAIRNSGTDGCYVDVYYYKTRRDFKPSVNLDTHFQNSYSNMPSNMGGSNQAYTTYGVTPFLAKDWTSYFTIFKKTSTLLGAGSQMDFTLSKKKNFMVDFDRVTNQGCLKGITIGCIVVVYGLPNQLTDSTAGQPVAATVNVNVTRTYTLTSNRSGLVDAGATVLTS